MCSVLLIEPWSFGVQLAEKNLMRDAVKQSENLQLETAMLEDKLRETDWELTQDTIEEQVARESYLQWLKEQEKQAKRQGSVSGNLDKWKQC